MTTADEHRPTLPVYLVNWTVPRQQRDAQKAAAAVGTGSLIQLVRTVLAELHSRSGAAFLEPRFLPSVQIALADALEDVSLERTEASWDRIAHTGSVHYVLDHPTWPQNAILTVPVKFCPGCHGRGGAHTAGCWASDKPALPRVDTPAQRG